MIMVKSLPNIDLSKPSMDSSTIPNGSVNAIEKVSFLRTVKLLVDGTLRAFQKWTLPKIFQEIKINISLHQRFNTLLENKVYK